MFLVITMNVAIFVNVVVLVDVVFLLGYVICENVVDLVILINSIESCNFLNWVIL